MKTKLLALFGSIACIVVVGGCASHAPAQQMSSDPVRVMTFNVRYDTSDDGEDAWPNRRNSVANLVRFYQPGFLGVQESLIHQHEQMQQDLADYAAFGVGRDDGKTGGEFSALFVRTSVYEVAASGTFWLSETPDVASVGWDATKPRIATWVRARRAQDGFEFLVVNTHWDHRGVVARQESANLIRNWIAEHRKESDTVILMGDLNVKPSAAPYRQVIAGETLLDTKTLSENPPFGPPGTSNGFDVFRSDAEPIDYIFSSPGVRVIRHGVITQHSAGRLPSDHYPIIVDLIPKAN